MCGIFGFVCPPGPRRDPDVVQAAIRTLIELSEPRGREATGVAVVLPGEVAVFRRPMAPIRVLAHPEFQHFLDTCFSGPSAAPPDTELAVLGHCRLVTNGTQAIERNNQPVVHARALGVHNGIVTNWEALVGEGVSSELDSDALFHRLSDEITATGNLGTALRTTFDALEGEASIALFAPAENELALATNSGCVYFSRSDAGGFVFASEAHILRTFLARTTLVPGAGPVRHLGPGRAVRVAIDTGAMGEFSLEADRPAPCPPGRCLDDDAGRPGSRGLSRIAPAPVRTRPVVDRTHSEPALRRCTRCILPATYPFITFDVGGVCNHCHEHVTQKVAGRDALLRELDRHRRSDGQPDCIVAFSGGRDSSYGLHLLKRELGMTPLAFTYDWGLVTDLARRNQARMCGTLGVEHIIRAADIPAQRRYIRQNIFAWLARPRLGMIPIFMAGDKFFYQHARELRKETGIDLVVFSAGNELERTPFKSGFAGVRENNYSNRLFGLAPSKKLRLAGYYGAQFLANPRYLNESLANSVRSFHSTFVGVDDFLYLYTYERWDEDQINRTLIDEYHWETSPETTNTWRIGDGYTAFINYIYHRVAGFSEYDTFRSHQIRDGLIDRERAVELAAADNRPRMIELGEFARLIGFNLEDVLTRIDAIPGIRPRA